MVDTIPLSQSTVTHQPADQNLHDNDCSEYTATASNSALNTSGNDDTSSHVNGIGNWNAYTRNVDTTSLDALPTPASSMPSASSSRSPLWEIPRRHELKDFLMTKVDPELSTIPLAA